jgi:phage shock protein A
MPSRFAILIGSSTYAEKSGLSNLLGPKNDVHILGDLLANPSIGQFDSVMKFVDADSRTVGSAVEETFSSALRDDLLLLYYSGHGKLDVRGDLCLTTSDTKVSALRATSIPLVLLSSIVNDSPCNRIIVILDCCYSGAAGRAFLKGAFDEQIRQLEGAGRHIISASSAIQTAKEREHASDGIIMGDFTRVLAGGIRTGSADIDQDGIISVLDAFEFIRMELRGQTPQHWGFRTSGHLMVARNHRPEQQTVVADDPSGSSLPVNITNSNLLSPSRSDGSALSESSMPQSSRITAAGPIPTYSTEELLQELDVQINARKQEISQLVVAQRFESARRQAQVAAKIALIGRWLSVFLPPAVVITVSMVSSYADRYLILGFVTPLAVSLTYTFLRPWVDQRIASTLVRPANENVEALKVELDATREGSEYNRLCDLREKLTIMIQRNSVKAMENIIMSARERQTRAKQEMALRIAEGRKAAAYLDNVLNEIEDWRKRARLALQQGREDLAKEALLAVSRREQISEKKRPQYDRSRSAEEAGVKRLRQMHSAIEEMQIIRNEALAAPDAFSPNSEEMQHFIQCAMFASMDMPGVEFPQMEPRVSEHWLAAELARLKSDSQNPESDA